MHKEEQNPKQEATSMAIDPICKMTVDEQKAAQRGLVLEKQGKKWYFCNRSCLETFKKK